MSENQTQESGTKKANNSTQDDRRLRTWQRLPAPTKQEQRSVADILNRAPSNLLTRQAISSPRTAVVQTKLTVNQPDDQYEQEADRVALTVMRMPSAMVAPPAHTAPPPLGNPLDSSRGRFLGREEVGDETDELPLKSPLQRTRPSQSVTTISQMSPIQAQLIARLHAAREEASEESRSVTPALENRIQSMNGGGNPLPDSERSFFESRMGADFGGVRIHNDSNAAQTSRDLSARAFTVGNNIAFNSGEYQPGTSAGRHLLAHELTHTVQQGAVGELQRKVEAQIQRATVVEPEVPQPEPVEVPSEVEQEQEKWPVEGAEASENSKEVENAEASPEAVTQTSAEAPSREETNAREAGQELVSTEEEEPAVGEVKEKQGPSDTEARIEETENAAGAEEATEVGEVVGGKEEQGIEQEATGHIAVGAAEGTGASAATGKGEQAQGALEQVSRELDAIQGEEQAITEEIVAKITIQKEEIAGQKAEAENIAQQANSGLENSISLLEELANAEIAFAPSEEESSETDEEMVVARKVDENTPGNFSRGEDVDFANADVNGTSASQMVGQLIAQSAGGVATIAALGQSVPTRLDPVAQEAQTAIQAAVKQNNATILGSIEQARAQAESEAEAARNQISTQYGNTVAAIEEVTQSARNRIETDYQTRLNDLTTLETTKTGEVNDLFTKAKEDVRQKGQSAAQEALNIGNKWEGTFQQEQYPEPGLLDGKDYYENKRKAKIDTAKKVAQGYHDEFITKAEQTASQLDSGIPDVVNEMKGKLETARKTLEQEKTAALESLEKAHQQSLATAEETKTNQLQAIDKSLEGTLLSLNELETRLSKQLNETGQQQSLAVERDAQEASTSLQEAVKQSTTNLEEALNSFATQISGIPAPHPVLLAPVLADVQAQMEGMITQTETDLENQISMAEQGLSESGQQAVETINNIGQQAVEQVTPLAEQFSSTISDLLQSATDAFTQLESDHTESTNAQVEQTLSNFEQAYTQCEQELNEITTCLKSGLNQFVHDFMDGDKGLNKALLKEDKEIPKKAEEAADKVQPAWKEGVAWFITIVITVVVAVAIAALIASGVGFGLGLLIAAGIGAVGGIAKGMVKNWAAGEDIFKDFWKNAALGALDGMLQFAGGRFVKGLKLPKDGFKEMATEAAMDMVSGTINDIASLAMDGKLTFETAFKALLSNGVDSLFSLAGNAATKKFTKGMPDKSIKKSLVEMGIDTVTDTASGVTTAVIKGEEITLDKLKEIAGEAALESFIKKGLDKVGFSDKLTETFNNKVKPWDDPTKTKNEFISDYKNRYPDTTLSNQDLAERFDKGKRLNPETGRLKTVGNKDKQPEQLKEGNKFDQEQIQSLKSSDPNWSADRKSTGIKKGGKMAGRQGYVDAINTETKEWREHKATNWNAPSYQSDSKIDSLIKQHINQLQSYKTSKDLDGYTGYIVYKNEPSKEIKEKVEKAIYDATRITVKWGQ